MLVEKPNGLNILACVQLHQLALRFQCNLILETSVGRADLRKIYDLLPMMAPKGAKVTIVAEGVDSERAVHSIRDFFAK